MAYVVSFLTISAAWLGHTELTDGLERADQILMRINLLLLLVVVFLPFPTRLVAASLHGLHGERVYVAMYGLTLLAIRGFGFALEEYGRREHLDSRVSAEILNVARQTSTMIATVSTTMGPGARARRPSSRRWLSRCPTASDRST